MTVQNISIFYHKEFIYSLALSALLHDYQRKVQSMSANDLMYCSKIVIPPVFYTLIFVLPFLLCVIFGISVYFSVFV